MKKRVLVIGGRGFLGRAVCKNLRSKHIVITLGRHMGPGNHRIGSINSLDDLNRELRGIDVLINLAGISPAKATDREVYEKAHVDGVKNIIKACKNNRVKKIIHISAFGADSNSKLNYFSTKGTGEQLVLKSKVPHLVLRPSLIYDDNNELIKMFSKISFLRLFPNFPAKFQPIHRSDVAKIIALAVDEKIRKNVIDVLGNETYSLFDIAKLVYKREKKICIPIPFSLAKIFLYPVSFLNLFGFGREQYKSLKIKKIGESNINRYIEPISFKKWISK